MKTVILGGPVLATAPTASRYYTIIDTDTRKQIATVEVNQATPRARTLFVQTPDSGEDVATAIMRLLLAVITQDRSTPIVANDTHAVLLAYALSGSIQSANEDIVKGWTSLNFEIEMVNEMSTGKTNAVRFVGANIVGIKAITKASSVTFVITAK